MNILLFSSVLNYKVYLQIFKQASLMHSNIHIMYILNV